MGKTFGATISIILASNLYSMHKIQVRSSETRLLNPTDQVLFTKHLLEASFIGMYVFWISIASHFWISFLYVELKEILRNRKKSLLVCRIHAILVVDYRSCSSLYQRNS